MVRPRNRLKELYPSVPLKEISEILSRNNGDYERSNIEIQQLLQGRNQGNAEGTGVIELLSSSDDEGKGKGEEVESIDENELLSSSSDESEQFQEDVFFFMVECSIDRTKAEQYLRRHNNNLDGAIAEYLEGGQGSDVKNIVY